MSALKLIFTILTLTICFHLAAQRTGTEKELNLKEIEKQADLALNEGKFEKALLLYRRLLDDNEKSPLLNFLVGFCYLNTDFGLEQAIIYFKNSIEFTSQKPSDQAPVESYYFLGQAYHANNQFNETTLVLNELLTKVSKNEIAFIAKINKLIDYSENGRMLTQSPADIKIENLLEINSKFSDRNPLVSKDENSILFSSRRESPLAKKSEDGQFDENIYYSEFKDEKWTLPYSVSRSLNTQDNETACWLSENGDEMIIHRDDKFGGNIFLVKKGVESGWGEPEKLSPPVNNGSATTYGSFSPDGRYLFFTSNRKGGFGGTDIYVVEKQGNNWGPAKNLGPEINTPDNEESPVLLPNGTLLFSSDGHLSMGGYDLFAALPDGPGKWKAPVNLGLPFNSTGNDFFYKPSPDGQSGYLSSERPGTKGKSDIYMISYSDSLMTTNSIIAGSITCPPGEDAWAKAEIIVRAESNKQIIKSIKPTKSGKFQMSLPSNNNYLLDFQYQNTPFYFAQVKIDPNYSVSFNDQHLVMNDIKVDPGKLIINSSVSREKYTLQSNHEADIKDAYLAILREINKITIDHTLTDDELLADSHFSIKLASSKQKLSLNSFSGISGVKEFTDKNGNYIYHVGEYEYEWEAQVRLRSIRESFPEASVFLLPQRNEN